MGRHPDPNLSFADLEFEAQGIALDPTLRAIAEFLDEHGDFVTRVHQDLVRGLTQPDRGRAGLTADQVLRAFILQRVKHWDLRELRERIADGYTLRRFTTFRGRRVPKHDAFHRAFTRLTPETLRALNEAVVHAAVTRDLEDGTQLRVDTTVVETDIHFPTDSTLLWDAVRVLTRLVGRLRAHQPTATRGFPNHTRRARRRMQELSRMTPAQRSRHQRRKYRDLLTVTEAVVAAARAVIAQVRTDDAGAPSVARLIAAVCQEIAHFCDLADRVIAQTRRRVLDGESVPVGEKLFSLFEPHTDLIVRGKARTPVEFGHKVFLAESQRGLITEYRVLAGNPPDEVQVAPSVAQHTATFGAPPALYAGDRGFHSPANVAALTAAGVTRECLPQRGGHKTPARAAYEKSPAFKQGQRFRAGIEGRISVLFRGRGMRRCPLEGDTRFEVFVGAAVLANNLMRIADLLRRPHGRRRRAA